MVTEFLHKSPPCYTPRIYPILGTATKNHLKPTLYSTRIQNFTPRKKSLQIKYITLKSLKHSNKKKSHIIKQCAKYNNTCPQLQFKCTGGKGQEKAAYQFIFLRLLLDRIQRIGFNPQVGHIFFSLKYLTHTGNVL